MHRKSEGMCEVHSTLQVTCAVKQQASQFLIVYTDGHIEVHCQYYTDGSCWKSLNVERCVFGTVE